MTDTRFKWTISAAAIVIIAVTAIICFAPKKQTAERKVKLGGYVYVDYTGTLHIDRKCKRLNYKDMESVRLTLDNVNAGDVTFCPNCVDDESYDAIKNRKQTQQ